MLCTLIILKTPPGRIKRFSSPLFFKKNEGYRLIFRWIPLWYVEMDIWTASWHHALVSNHLMVISGCCDSDLIIGQEKYSKSYNPSKNQFFLTGFFFKDVKGTYEDIAGMILCFGLYLDYPKD